MMSARGETTELVDCKCMHRRSRYFLVQLGLSRLSLEDDEQGHSIDCKELNKLHDPLGRPIEVPPGFESLFWSRAPTTVESRVPSNNKSIKPLGTCSFLEPAAGVASPCTDANPLLGEGGRDERQYQ
jgi:hypothetical protein